MPTLVSGRARCVGTGRRAAPIAALLLSVVAAIGRDVVGSEPQPASTLRLRRETPVVRQALPVAHDEPIAPGDLEPEPLPADDSSREPWPAAHGWPASRSPETRSPDWGPDVHSPPPGQGCEPRGPEFGPQGPGRPFLPGLWSPPGGRHQGRGEPLELGSWQYRPWFVSGLAGLALGDDLIDGQVEQDAGGYLSFGLGKDLNPYWGAEARYLAAWYYVPDTLPGLRDTVVQGWDARLLYYPWGDSRWRPYVALGVGSSHYRFHDAAGVPHGTSELTLPIGLGLKYRYDAAWTIRCELLESVSFGRGALDPMQNLSILGGLEWHFGGRRRSYWPWAQP